MVFTCPTLFKFFKPCTCLLCKEASHRCPGGPDRAPNKAERDLLQGHPERVFCSSLMYVFPEICLGCLTNVLCLSVFFGGSLFGGWGGMGWAFFHFNQVFNMASQLPRPWPVEVLGLSATSTAALPSKRTQWFQDI